MVTNGYAIINQPSMADYMSVGVRPDVATSTMVSMKSQYPSPLAIDTNNVQNSWGPLRVIVTGSAANAVLDHLILEDGWAIMPVTPKAAAFRAGVSPDTARHALSSFMRCYPYPILFTGGTSYDHEWLVARRAVILQVEDNMDVHVRASASLSDPYWMDHSKTPFETKMRKALTVVSMITSDFKAHVIPKEYSSLSA